MNAEYKRDLQNNYLILEAPQGVDENDYRLKMAEQNQVPGLLAFHSARKDGVLYFHYEITSKQPLGSVFEKRTMGYHDIFFLLAGIRDILEAIQKFLLEPSQLVFDPEYIFVDPDMCKVQLCYFPGSEGGFPLTILAEFILKKLDHKEQQAVVLGYGFYQKMSQENFSLQQTLKEILAKEEQPGGRPEERTMREGEIPPYFRGVPGDERPAAGGRRLYGGDRGEDGGARKAAGGRRLYGGDRGEDGIRKAAGGRRLYGGDRGEDGIRKATGGRRPYGGDRGEDESRKAAGGRRPYGGDCEEDGSRPAAGGPDEGYLDTEWDGVSPEIRESFKVTHRERTKHPQRKIDRLFQLIHPAVLLSTLSLLAVLEAAFYFGMLTLTETGGIFFLLISVEVLVNKYWRNSKEKKKENRWAAEDEDEMYRMLQEEMYEIPEEGPVIGETQCLSPEQEPSGLCLVCIHAGPSGTAGPDIPVGSSPVYIGKIPGESDVILDSPTVSRRHARLECRDGICYVKDLNSRNGTFCNGRRLHPQEQCQFVQGDEISFAEIGYRAVLRQPARG